MAKKKRVDARNMGVVCRQCAVEVRVGLEMRAGRPVVMGFWFGNCRDGHQPKRAEVQRWADEALAAQQR